MKLIHIIFIFLFFPGNILMAQRGPTVAYSWSEAGIRAVEERKILLVAVGLDPTDSKVKRLMNNPEVRDFMERNVVLLFMDMKSDEGKRFESKLLLYDWPAYFYFMPFGDLLAVVKPDDVYRNTRLLPEIGREALQIAERKRSNSRSIVFKPNGTEELTVAKEQGKPLFIYGFNNKDQTSVLMEKNIFTLDSVADFFNSHFINLYTDTIISVKYPIYRFLNQDGKFLLEEYGNKNKDELIALGEKALLKDQGVIFKDFLLQNLLNEARINGKNIFIDSYILRKDEDKSLQRAIYRDPELAAYLDANFINSRVNLRSEEGKKLLEALPEGVEPVYIFLDPSGKPLHWLVGEVPAEDLKREAVAVLTGQGVVGQTKEYPQRKEDILFLKSYLITLEKAGLPEKAAEIVKDFFSGKNSEVLTDKAYWDIFERFYLDAHSGLFEYLLNNKPVLENLYGKNRVESKILQIWKAGAYSYVRKENGNYVFDKKGLNNYRKLLRKEKVAEWRDVIFEAEMWAAEKTGNWPLFAELAEERWNQGKVSQEELYSWGVKIRNNSENPSVRYQAARWFALELEKIEQKERTTGRVMHTMYKGYYRQLVDELLKE